MGSSSSKSSSSSSESSRKSDDRFTPEEKCSCGDEYLTAKRYHHCRTTLFGSEKLGKCPILRHHFIQVAYSCNNCSRTFNKVYDFGKKGESSKVGTIRCMCEDGNHVTKMEFDQKLAYDVIEEAITKYNKTVRRYSIFLNNCIHYAAKLFKYLKKVYTEIGQKWREYWDKWYPWMTAKLYPWLSEGALCILGRLKETLNWMKDPMNVIDWAADGAEAAVDWVGSTVKAAAQKVWSWFF